LDRPEKLTVRIEGRGILADQDFLLAVPAQGQIGKDVTLPLLKPVSGRQVFTLWITGPDGVDGSDAFLAIDGHP
jgi:hypothetical protein